MDILIVKYYVCQNQSKNANFGLPKVCFWPKILSKADHFEECSRSAKGEYRFGSTGYDSWFISVQLVVAAYNTD